MKSTKFFLLVGVLVVLAACYDIDRVRPNNVAKVIEKHPDRGVIYLTYSYYNPKGEYIDALGVYRFIWNYKQPRETYYLLEMENTRSNEMVVYYTAPTVISPKDFILSNTIVHTIMLRHNFPEQVVYVKAGEVVYLGHIYIHITNTKVGFIPTTGYKFYWEDREAEDRAKFVESFPQLANWSWRKEIIQLYPSPQIPLMPQQPQPPVQPAPAAPQVIYVTNVIVVTNTTNQ
ncbi:hypothetical protein [Thermospira aquatica]|uniref:Uncharacterized protein n=1 Tax=Thermospira aquatica TaxID=2828656 RepID=A0AAX3BFA3_9SPIR|nr:hypothetical protein [Thermospira aquatica]URA10808.1 hypothetical protein KDW03_03105 [Thermospira aquatica]